MSSEAIFDQLPPAVTTDAGASQVDAGRSAPARRIAPPKSPASVQLVIEPANRLQLIDFRELWQFRELLYYLAWRDVKVRYKQTVLGAAWAVLQPALMMVVFTVFFARMAQVPTGDIPYPLFVYAGLLPWTLFATAVAQAAQSVVNSERLITKIYFPRLAIPWAAVGVAVVDFVVALGLLVVLMAWYGFPPSPRLLLAPAIVACLLLAAAGVGTMLAALNVAYRDFRYVVPFLLQIWMFATPTVYMDPSANGMGHLDWLLVANPLSPLIAAFRVVITGEGSLPWIALTLAALGSAVMFIAGCLYFRHVEDTFSDII
jgi:lipopolysaccharide transport system permease protein